MVKDNNPCRECNGIGILRNDDPNSDRVYGEYCPSCNGTGIAGDPLKGCLIVGLTVVLTVAPLVWWLW